MNARWEVEQKYFVDDTSSLLVKLTDLQFSLQATEHHQDTYYRHPCRDLRATDEAFRLRIFDHSACLTYKGPRLSDPQSGEVKTRLETELSIDATQADAWRDMLDKLGFVPLPTVTKERCIYIARALPGMVLALDNVEQLGQFAEIELIVSDSALLQDARQRISAVGLQLGLFRVQPRSYLSQLLAKLSMQ